MTVPVAAIPTYHERDDHEDSGWRTDPMVTRAGIVSAEQHEAALEQWAREQGLDPATFRDPDANEFEEATDPEDFERDDDDDDGGGY